MPSKSTPYPEGTWDQKLGYFSGRDLGELTNKMKTLINKMKTLINKVKTLINKVKTLINKVKTLINKLKHYLTNPSDAVGNKDHFYIIVFTV